MKERYKIAYKIATLSYKEYLKSLIDSDNTKFKNESEYNKAMGIENKKNTNPKSKKEEKQKIVQDIADSVVKKINTEPKYKFDKLLLSVLHEEQLPEKTDDLIASTNIRNIIEDNFNEQNNHIKRRVKKVQKLTKGFTEADYETKGKGGNLSKLVKQSTGKTEDDWRIKKYGSDEDYDDKDVEAFKAFRKKEQDILINSGLVDEDGNITLFRSTKQVKGNVGDKVSVKGTYADSWTTKPSLGWNEKDDSTVKVMAKVPVEKAIQSYVGVSESGDWSHENECEVTIDGSEPIDTVIVKNNKEENKDIGKEVVSQFKRRRKNKKEIAKNIYSKKGVSI